MTLDARRQKRELGHLAKLLEAATTPALRRRLRVVYLFCEDRLTVVAIARRVRISRATAFAYWQRYREAGPEGLLQIGSVGRPRGIPPVVRQRFDYLNLPDPYTGEELPFVYITERERLVFRTLGKRYHTSQLSRWLRQYAQEKGLKKRLRRFRVMQRGYAHLLCDYRLDLLECLDLGLSWKRTLRADALLYASKLHPEDRNLYRRALAICFAITPREVAFPDEPKSKVATVVWNGPAPSIESVLEDGRRIQRTGSQRRRFKLPGFPTGPSARAGRRACTSPGGRI